MCYTDPVNIEPPTEELPWPELLAILTNRLNSYDNAIQLLEKNPELNIDSLAITTSQRSVLIESLKFAMRQIYIMERNQAGEDISNGIDIEAELAAEYIAITPNI